MNSKKRIILFATIIFISFIGYGYYLYHKPVSSIANVNPDFNLNADELLDSYTSDEVTANQKYLDKVIIVSGRVQKIEENKTIFLETSNPLSSIICELEEASLEINITPGDYISIKGICTGYLMDVVLNRAILIKQ